MRKVLLAGIAALSVLGASAAHAKKVCLGEWSDTPHAGLW
jgi:hypothetical protein